MRFTCPGPILPGLLVGCGSVFDGEVDEEGLIDCPECGLWFNPEEEAARAEERAEAAAEAGS